jgi:hypothetical protein
MNFKVRLKSKIMASSNDSKDRSHFPTDLAALLGFYWIMLPIAVLGGLILPKLLEAKNNGDMTLLWIALGLGCIGTAILFLARRPLYRERRFHQLGPRGLNPLHKRLYKWAWCFIGLSIALLGLLLVVAR